MTNRMAVNQFAFTVALMSLAAAGMVLSSDAAAQQTGKSLKDQLVGSWVIVSATSKLPDGSPAWGTNPKGVLMFMENGRYATILVRSDRPKFAGNNRLQGTPDENKAAVHGSIGSFGKYTVDEAAKNFTVRFEASTYPNLEGVEQSRTFIIQGDELKVQNPAPTVGGPPSELVYRREK